jgi:lipid-A-disaccharide synthase-like uncharacterized protein
MNRAGMDWLSHLLWPNGRFLGADWQFWKIVGWAGNAIFFSRFFVQWWATERRKEVVMPNAFWWLSLVGSSCLLAYGLHVGDSVFIFAYVFTWIPYIRNLVISHRVSQDRQYCRECQCLSPARARFCPECGTRLPAPDAGVPA